LLLNINNKNLLTTINNEFINKSIIKNISKSFSYNKLKNEKSHTSYIVHVICNTNVLQLLKSNSKINIGMLTSIIRKSNIIKTMPRIYGLDAWVISNIICSKKIMYLLNNYTDLNQSILYDIIDQSEYIIKKKFQQPIIKLKN